MYSFVYTELKNEAKQHKVRIEFIFGPANMVMNAAYSPHWLQAPHMIRVSLYSHEGVFDGLSLPSPFQRIIICVPTFFSSAFTLFICSHVCIFLLHLRRIEVLVVRIQSDVSSASSWCRRLVGWWYGIQNDTSSSPALENTWHELAYMWKRGFCLFRKKLYSLYEISSRGQVLIIF